MAGGEKRTEFEEGVVPRSIPDKDEKRGVVPRKIPNGGSGGGSDDGGKSEEGK